MVLLEEGKDISYVLYITLLSLLFSLLSFVSYNIKKVINPAKNNAERVINTIKAIFRFLEDDVEDLLFLRAAKTGYFEAIMMYVVDIILYLGLAIFIQSYKDSGLPFCSFLKSCCTKVSRQVEINYLFN